MTLKTVALVSIAVAITVAAVSAVFHKKKPDENLTQNSVATTEKKPDEKHTQNSVAKDKEC